MADNERQQRLVERIQEDERLRGDLGGEAASALVAWASARTLAVAADATRPDQDVDADVQAIRTAAQQAARSGLTAVQELIANAEATLAARASPELASTPRLNPVQTDQTEAPAHDVAPPATPLPVSRPRWFGRVRRRVGERIRHWFRRKDP